VYTRLEDRPSQMVLETEVDCPVLWLLDKVTVQGRLCVWVTVEGYFLCALKAPARDQGRPSVHLVPRRGQEKFVAAIELASAGPTVPSHHMTPVICKWIIQECQRNNLHKS
jgi:hypothetical protein